MRYKIVYERFFAQLSMSDAEKAKRGLMKRNEIIDNEGLCKRTSENPFRSRGDLVTPGECLWGLFRHDENINMGDNEGWDKVLARERG